MTQCSEQVWRRGTWHPSRCQRVAKVERNGRGYCRQHDPEVVARRRAEQEARWKAEAAADQRRHAKTRLAVEAFDTIAGLAEIEAAAAGLERIWCSIQDWKAEEPK